MKPISQTRLIVVTNEAAAWQLNTAANEVEAVLYKKWGYVVLIRSLLLIGQSGLKITAQAARPSSLSYFSAEYKLAV